MTPKKQNSLRLVDLPTPKPDENEVLLEVLRVGICGTDRDIIAGFYGEAPQGSDVLVLGHESLCRVASVGASVKGLRNGDLVVPTVRRNCPENCINCASGESDMCRTGHYREHGIKQLHGFASEFALSDASFIVKLSESLSHVGVLLEPLTVVEKGLIQTYTLQNARMTWKPGNALVLGAGPVGLLATAILRLKGLQVDTIATRSKDSLKATLVESTGASYINAKETPINSIKKQYDIVFEITGNPMIAAEAQQLIGVNGVVCYMGIYSKEQDTEDVGKIFTDLVLGNKLHFGSVNANKSYFARGADDLLNIQKTWPDFLSKMITRKGTPDSPDHAYVPESREDIKTVIEFKT